MTFPKFLFGLFMLITCSGKLSAQNAPISHAGLMTTFQNELIIPITVSDFSNIGSGNLRLNYDPSVAIATSVNKSASVSGTLNFNVSTPGVVTLGWFTFPALNLPDNSVIFTIHFIKVSSSTSSLTFDDSLGYSCEWSDEDYLPLNDIPTENYYIDGSFTFLSMDAPLVTAPVLSAFGGETIEVPITAAGFNLIGSFRLTLEYNPLSLQYQSVINNSGFPGLTVVDNTGGKIKIEGYSGSDGISLPDESILFTLVFYYSGGNSGLIWYDDGTSCEFRNYPDFIVLNDIPADSFYFNGSVSERIKMLVRLFLEGPFTGSGMTTTMNDLNILPLVQPYSLEPWNYNVMESVVSIPDNVVDWILIELRQTNGGASSATSDKTIGRKAGFLLNNGLVKDLDGSQKIEFVLSSSGYLYVVVYHRNHLPVISSGAVALFNGNGFYDFTTGELQALGGSAGHKELALGAWGLIGGDGLSNSEVNQGDISEIWSDKAGIQGYFSADYNLDSQIDNQDKNEVWRKNLGAASQVPD